MTFQHSRTALALALSAAILAACTAPAGGPWPREGVADIASAVRPATLAPGTGLTIAIAPMKPVVELGEPVYVAVRVTNSGAEPRHVAGYLTPGDGLVDIVIEGPGGRREFRPLGESDFGADAGVTLAPGETRADVAAVFFGADGWTFGAPGSYRLGAELLVPDGQGRFAVFRAEPVALEVIDVPAGRAFLAAEGVPAAEAGKYLLWRSGDHLVAGLGHLGAVAERHPGSAVAAYYRAARINALSEPFANYLKGEVRPADCRAAAAVPDAGLAEILPENLIVDAALDRARCKAGQGDRRGALSDLKDARARASERPELAELARRAAEMEAAIAQSER